MPPTIVWTMNSNTCSVTESRWGSPDLTTDIFLTMLAHLFARDYRKKIGYHTHIHSMQTAESRMWSASKHGDYRNKCNANSCFIVCANTRLPTAAVVSSSSLRLRGLKNSVNLFPPLLIARLPLSPLPVSFSLIRFYCNQLT